LGCFSHNKNLNGIEDVDEQIAGIHNGGLACLCNRFSGLPKFHLDDVSKRLKSSGRGTDSIFE